MNTKSGSLVISDKLPSISLKVVGFRCVRVCLCMCVYVSPRVSSPKMGLSHPLILWNIHD